MIDALRTRRLPRTLLGLTIGVAAALKLASPSSAIRAVELSPADLLAEHATAVFVASVLLEAAVAWVSLRRPWSPSARAVPIAFVLLLVATRALDLLPTCACFGPLSADVPRDVVLGSLLTFAALDALLQPAAATSARGALADRLVLASVLAGAAVVAAAAIDDGTGREPAVIVRDLVVRTDERGRTIHVSGDVVNVSAEGVRDIRVVPACPGCVRSARGSEIPRLAAGEEAGFEIIEELDADRGEADPGLHVWFAVGRRSHRLWVPYPTRRD